MPAATRPWLVLLLFLFPNPLVWADPDFGKIDDVLQGRRNLLRNDDLVILGNTCQTSRSSCYVRKALLQTADSKVVKTEASSMLTGSYPRSNGALALGRFFNVPNDVIVTVVARDSDVLYEVRDPATNGHAFGTVPTPRSWRGAYFAGLADFNRDGYPDVAIHDGQGGVLIGTAKDVSNLTAGLVWKGGSSLTFDDRKAPMDVTVGDFRGDGRLFIVRVGGWRSRFTPLIPQHCSRERSYPMSCRSRMERRRASGPH
jgi:hypothetical protein